MSFDDTGLYALLRSYYSQATGVTAYTGGQLLYELASPELSAPRTAAIRPRAGGCGSLQMYPEGRAAFARFLESVGFSEV